MQKPKNEVPTTPIIPQTQPRSILKRIGRSEWCNVVPEHEFAIYAKALKAVRPLGWPYMLGGAFGLACYTGRWRNTKDMDLFVLPEHRQAFIDSLLKAGFVDYYDTLPYDRAWIFRAAQEGLIVDIIWTTPNQRSQVDTAWIERAAHISFRGEPILAIPPEELIFIKAFVIQKDRCDWTDILNVLCFQSAHLNWSHLIDRFGPDLPLLRAIINVFAWVCPVEAAQIPEDFRETLKIEGTLPDDPAAETRTRVALLDSRPWFAAYQPMDQPMKI